MIFTLIPQRCDETLALRVTGDVLEINGVQFDFSSVEEGHVLPPSAVQSPWVAGPVTRKKGRIHAEILVPLGPDARTNERFPGELHQDHNGLVDLTRVERKRG